MRKASFSHFETETHIWTKQLIFYSKELFKLSSNNKSSLTKAEWKDSLTLKNNSKLIIKEADKGGCIVLMKESHYKIMIFQHFPKNRSKM